MSDHTEVLEKVKRSPNVRYTALTPNLKGFNGAVSRINDQCQKSDVAKKT